MKLTKTQLKQIIKEELSNLLAENFGEADFKKYGIHTPEIVSTYSAINMKEHLEEQWERWDALEDDYSGQDNTARATEEGWPDPEAWRRLLDPPYDYLAYVKAANTANLLGTGRGTRIEDLEAGIAAFLETLE